VIRVLVTGASGMVGRNLLAHPGIASFQVLAPGREDLQLGDGDAVRSFMAENRPDVVVHLAGRVGGIQANSQDLFGFLHENLTIGTNVVLAAREARVSCLINVASSCMYPKDVSGQLTEDAILSGPLEPTNEGYALAKIVVMRLCQYVSEQSGGSLAYKTLIPCNLFGPWDTFSPDRSHLVPAAIRKIHDALVAGSSEVEIWGDGEARREFLFAPDFADCLVRAIERFGTLPTVANVGLGFDFTVNEYYQAIARVVGYSGAFRHDLTRLVGMRRKVLDPSRIHTWGWQATTTLEDGIRKTYQHYLSTASV